MTTPMNCPKWDGCNANYCPLDDKVRIHLRDEATCFYMREAARGTPPNLFQLTEELFVLEAANDHVARWDDLPYELRKGLSKAAKYSSRRVQSKTKKNTDQLYGEGKGSSSSVGGINNE